ncbi:barnase inhibitor [Pseudoxanthomonas sp. SGNA-20]|jgi:Barstar (barnase inhibitor).|uniref:Barstar (Barnase inhibitor) n=1 Tax=Pseudoxanthomonas taiwanensis J19 TaxID=935569 RepID=A0A562CZA9_9GAMM|nr:MULTISPECIES: barstar family protein [Pseudoxanthomonas]RRN57121.1 barnase inhibitor [Pseudoxanthomonas sp. SGNA-20]RRN79959.1 barnase inhibitor [Pseudoxanthomonas sp. SGD-10]TWH02760.1 barstar (barnase inhibitor) [Pseudoxanthomonas taiwanensis J19]
MTHSGFDLGLDDATRAGVYEVAAADLAALAAAARDAGLLVRRIDLEGCRDKAALLLRIATTLDFPAGWGRNWDGLLDALRDLSWAPAPGYLLAIDGFAGLQGTRPQDLQTLVEVLDDAVRWWAEAGVPFWAFLAPDSTPRNTGRAK